MRILYIEDNQVDIDLTVRFFKKSAPTIIVDTAKSQYEALSIIRSTRFSNYDLVLTDMNLQDGDGIAILSHIRGHSIPVAVVLITGQGDEESAVAALKAGADDYVVKKKGYLEKLPAMLRDALRSYQRDEERKNRGLNVLYVEHNVADIDLTIRHLQKHASHINVQICSSVNMFYDLVEKSNHLTQFDVLLLDYRLPQDNAIDILKWLHSTSNTRIPIILVTGKGDEEIAVKAIKLGAFDYVTKNQGYLFKLPSIIENAYYSCRLQGEHEALIESEMRYRSLFEENHMVMLLIDPESDLLIDANPAAVEFYGWSRDELRSKYMHQINILNADEIRREKELAVEEGRNYCLFRHRRADSTIRDVEVFNGSLTWGGVSYHYAIVHDVTQRIEYQREKEKLQEQVLQNQKLEAISILAGGIAHDFNNMLGVITGNISYSLSQCDKDHELYDVLLEVSKGAKQAQTLTRQLLTFAKGGEPVKKTIDLNHLIQESALFVTRGATVQCVFRLSEKLYAVDADRGQMHQVISNLIINAIQAMPNGGIIEIHTENYIADTSDQELIPGTKYVKIEITDQGAGIDQDQLSKIFDPFYTTKKKGSGLGLSTVYSIIKRHEGHISVRSEVGQGTRFTLILPSTDKLPPKTQENSKVIHLGEGNVLVLDDQVSILKMLGKMLHRMGYETTAATHGFEAVEYYKVALENRNPFKFVILDLTVPGGMGGAETLMELKKIDPNVVAISSSGYSTDPIMSNFEHHGFAGVIPKPYTQSQVAEVLNRIFP